MEMLAHIPKIGDDNVMSRQGVNYVTLPMSPSHTKDLAQLLMTVFQRSVLTRRLTMTSCHISARVLGP
jgi:hypothetical protein